MAKDEHDWQKELLCKLTEAVLGNDANTRYQLRTTYESYKTEIAQEPSGENEAVGPTTGAVPQKAMSITETWAAEVMRLNAENGVLKYEIDMLRGGIDLMQEQNAALSFKNAQLQAAATPDAAMPEATPDVGDVWRALQKGEKIMEGDEAYYALIGWKSSHLKVGTVVGDGTMRFRRRVTPEAPAPQFPKVESLARLNERARFLQKIAALRGEIDQQQEIILHAGLEVERLRLENEQLKKDLKSLWAN